MRGLIKLFESFKPEKIFLLLAGFFGLLFLLLTPPLQVPDEPAHFLRAWQISEGNFFADREDNRVGGWVPLSLEKFSHPYWLAIFPGTPVTIDTLIHSSVLATKPEIKKFKDFNNTALYSPLCYAPQALGIFIFRVAGANPFYCFYAGRLFAFITWLLSIFFAIRMIPFQKWLFTMLAMLPMSLYINMSMSADVMTNAMCFLFIAMVLRYAFDEGKITERRFIGVLIICFMLISMKSIYAALLLLLFIIPRSKFGSLKHYLIKIGTLTAVSAGSIVMWTSMLKPSLITYEQYNPVFRDDLSIVAGANAELQMNYILEHGTYFLNVFARSVVSAFEMYSTGYIGVFGWLSLPLPLWLVIFAWLSLFVLACTENNSGSLQWKQTRMFFFIVFVILFILVFLSQHLIWDPVGGPVISNIQGRYLIPVLPLLFIALTNGKIKGQVVIPVLLVFFIGMLLFSTWMIYSKYLGIN